MGRTSKDEEQTTFRGDKKMLLVASLLVAQKEPCKQGHFHRAVLGLKQCSPEFLHRRYKVISDRILLDRCL